MPFSQKHADVACTFFQKFLHHTADDWWGEPFELCAWQEEALTTIFGNVDDAGNHVIELVYLEVPKKAGKAEFAAGLALYTLVLTNTPGCQVYGAAAATRQALQVYLAACKMVEQSSALRKLLRIMRGTHRILKRKDPDSFYAAVAADGDFGDGVNPALVVADEVHRWKTRKQLENWDVLSKGGITRRQTLTIAITTAGVQNESPLAWRLHEKTRRIDEGVVTDHRFFGKLYGAAAEDDPADPATWHKANPSLLRFDKGGNVIDGFLSEDKIRKEYESAESEGDLTAFKRYFLNIWDQKENRAIGVAKWDAGAGEWAAAGLLPKLPEDAVRTLPHDFMARFFQRTCWAGVDLSMTTDLTSVVFLFDRRGCFAAMTQASASGFTVSGAWSDQADFVVLMLFDADDQFGHLLANRYLPDFSLAGVTLDFDLAVRGCMSPIGPKYQSVPWGALSYINSSEASGVVPLPAPTSNSGGAAASVFFSLVGTPTNYDRIQLVYLGNEVFDSDSGTVIATGQTLAQVAANMAALINSVTSPTVPLSATSAGIATTVAASIATGSQTVTPAAMTDIVVGTALTVANSDGSNGEIVTVTAITPTTFTAVFTSAKTGPGITVNGGVLAVTCTQPGRDGNGIELLAMYKTAGNTGIYPFGRPSTASGQTAKLTGGVDPTSMHFHLDFSALALASCRQIWLTLAPGMTYDSSSPSTVAFAFLNSFGTGYSHFVTIGSNTYTYAQLAGDTSAGIAAALAALVNAGVDPNATASMNGGNVILTARTNSGASVACSASDGNTAGTLVESGLCSLVAFASTEFSMVFSNWTVVDSSGVTPLKVAGPGSVTVGSRDAWASYSGTGWSLQVGSYFHGFARQSGHATDSATVTYWCQQAHQLYLGTQLSTSGGEFSISVDGAAAVTINSDADALSPVYARRLIAAGVAAGNHTVVLTVASGTCVFDYLQAAMLSDPAPPPTTYANVSAAADFDTDQTYKIPPARVLWNYQQLGLLGDLDFYAGVFFALKRVRNGGSFHSATVTLTGPFGSGSGFGDGDVFWVDISGTSLGAAMYPADNPDGSTLAQRLIDAVNGTFVGIHAAPTSTPGRFTVRSLSPINGFTMSVSAGSGSTGSIAMTGDIGAGTEGTWQVDASQASPLNRAFQDYLADLCALWHAAGMSVTVAFSQELLAPPDANTAAGAWTQRFADGTQVLTATGFGTWGEGLVEAVNGSTIQETGHGYITGNTWHAAGSSGSGAWLITVLDADHFSLTTEVSNSGAYTPGVTDAACIELQTSQCCFNPATVTAFLAACYDQAASIMNACGLTPCLA